MVVDLIPAKKASDSSSDHLLFHTERNRQAKTNLYRHTSLIQGCGWLNEIRALKTWRNLKEINFPSFYLELTVIDALRHRTPGQLAANVTVVLQYLHDRFAGAPVRDPENFDSLISDDLLEHEKLAIESAAAETLENPDWDGIIW